ncbi:MAG: hypothetical protein QNJ87_07420 [Gammaproteobacteria bacterium]|nr:hypothetical protein [Gammaproteobacteria bacterium]
MSKQDEQVLNRGDTGRWVLLGFAWAVPLGFLLLGTWPFGLFPAILLTIWMLLSRRYAPRA